MDCVGFPLWPLLEATQWGFQRDYLYSLVCVNMLFLNENPNQIRLEFLYKFYNNKGGGKFAYYYSN